MKKHARYIPAFHFHWLTRWYDPMMRRFFPETEIKVALIAQAGIQPEQFVLDVGCGTGTMILLIKQTESGVTAYGLDMDLQVLSIAQEKIERAGEVIMLQQSSATCLPYLDASFDRVFASLMLHHLTRQDKRQMLQETFRVLKPGGQLHVVDFGAPHDAVMWLISCFVRWFEEIHDHVLGLLPTFMTDAGFDPVRETARYRTLAGSIILYCASKPEGNRSPEETTRNTVQSLQS